MNSNKYWSMVFDTYCYSLYCVNLYVITFI